MLQTAEVLTALCTQAQCVDTSMMNRGSGTIIVEEVSVNVLYHHRV